jgi:hypothetical protein
VLRMAFSRIQIPPEALCYYCKAPTSVFLLWGLPNAQGNRRTPQPPTLLTRHTSPERRPEDHRSQPQTNTRLRARPTSRERNRAPHQQIHQSPTPSLRPVSEELRKGYSHRREIRCRRHKPVRLFSMDKERLQSLSMISYSPPFGCWQPGNRTIEPADCISPTCFLPTLSLIV